MMWNMTLLQLLVLNTARYRDVTWGSTATAGSSHAERHPEPAGHGAVLWAGARPWADGRCAGASWCRSSNTQQPSDHKPAAFSLREGAARTPSPQSHHWNVLHHILESVFGAPQLWCPQRFSAFHFHLGHAPHGCAPVPGQVTPAQSSTRFRWISRKHFSRSDLFLSPADLAAVIPQFLLTAVWVGFMGIHFIFPTPLQLLLDDLTSVRESML